MSQRSNVRLFVLGALMLSLVLTLIGRLFYLQVMTGEEYKVAAVNNTVREVVEPAVRGLILDQVGRPLVSNRTSLVITVDKIELSREHDGGDLAVALDLRLGARLRPRHDFHQEAADAHAHQQRRASLVEEGDLKVLDHQPEHERAREAHEQEQERRGLELVRLRGGRAAGVRDG